MSAAKPHAFPTPTPATGPMVPEDAPFNPAQRQWLNGFLTGLTVVARATQGAAGPQAPAPAAPLAVWYGSQSGNSEALSKDLRKHGRSRGFDPEIAELDSVDLNQLATLDRLIIVTSTFGEGDPPDNAKAFYDQLMADDAPKLPASLHYSVCGLGDRSYTHFNKCALDLDRQLAQLGATRAADAVLCDVAYEDDYAAWKEAVFASQPFASAASDTVPTLEDRDDADEASPGHDKNNPFPGTLLDNTCLSGEASAKRVHHIALSLAGSGLTYDVGDALGVWPVNCPQAVDALLRAAGLTGRERVELKGDVLPIQAACLNRLDICTATSLTAQALGFDRELDGRHVVDLLEQIHTKPSAQQLADALRPLQPRLYSIASSPHANPGEVHLTVGQVHYQTHERARQGVASTFLGDRCPVGATVRLYVQKSAHFHLPDDDDAAIIMIGPGTGIAPFRAFLEERSHRGAAGPNWLFFGDQHRASNFLYADQLLAMQDQGTLSRLDLAWSRDQAQKVYVQDRMRQQGQTFYQWLEDGAFVYVCGDAGRMALDVDRALHALIAEHGQLSETDAETYVQNLIAAHRYRRDVY